MLLPDGTTSFQALQNALSGTGGRARLLRLRSPAPGRSGPHARAARGPQERCCASCCSAAPSASPIRYSSTSRARGPSSSRRPAGSRWKASSPSGATRRTTPAAAASWLKVKCLQRAGVRDRRVHGPPQRLARGRRRAAPRRPRRAGRPALRGQGRHRLHGRERCATCERRSSASSSRVSVRGAPGRAREGAPGCEPELVAEVAVHRVDPATAACAIPRSRACARTSAAREVVRETPAARGGGARSARERASTAQGAPRARSPSPGNGRRRPPRKRPPRRPLRRGRHHRACASPIPTACCTRTQGMTKRDLAQLLRGDRGLDPAAPRGPAADAGALPGRRAQAVLLPEAPGLLGPGDAAARPDPREDEDRRVPRGRRPARPRRPRPDRHPRDPHLELASRTGSSSPTGSSSTSTPIPRSSWARVIDGAAPGPRAARGARARELREDDRRQGPPRRRADRARPELGRGRRLLARPSPNGIARESPRRYTAEMSKAKREGQDLHRLPAQPPRRDRRSPPIRRARARGAPVSMPLALGRADAGARVRSLHDREPAGPLAVSEVGPVGPVLDQPAAPDRQRPQGSRPALSRPGSRGGTTMDEKRLGVQLREGNRNVRCASGADMSCGTCALGGETTAA